MNKDDKFAKIFGNDLKDFFQNYYPGCSNFGDTFEDTDRFEIQKSSKRSLQIMGFVHTRILCFLSSDFCV